MLFLAFEEGMCLAELLEDKMYHSTSNKNDANLVKTDCVFLVYVGFLFVAKYLDLAVA